MADTQLTETDEGKTVVNADGDEIGVISDFRAGQAYVDPDPGITDKVMSSLGWTDADEEHYALNEDQVEHVTDDEVRLSSGL
ncbi:PRC-barrel domain containing protein [Halomicroarcula sp. F28]|uniref:PRC-barrel domain containing protein n=1 Tax=Haloarcula salinisoli TaxID=2487746 RepID=UPI001C72AFF6|nr:PRC-barrel domain containing protein [Halomicroarcula salinisoli]MBX0288227.1 PRC-barrel domain containing protein [Halomicroarcula salinisoli]